MAGSRAQTLLRPSRDWTPLTQIGALTLSAGVITDVTRLAGVEGDGEAYPFGGVYVGPAAANLGDTVGDMSFESLAVGSNMATDGWTNSTGGTAVISDEVVKFGTKSGKLTTGGASLYQRLELPFTSTPGTYTWAVWLYAPSPLTKVRLAFGGPTDGAVLSNELAVGDEWVQFSVTKTITVTETVKATIYVSYGVNTSGAVLYLSGPMPVLSPIALPFTPTSRVAGTVVLASPSTKGISGVQGGFVMRLRPGWGNSAEPSHPRLWVMRGGSGIHCYYETSTNVWRISPGNAEHCDLAAAITSGDSYTVYGYWKAAQCGIGYNGSALTTAARTLTCTATSLELLYDSLVASREFNGAVEWAAFFGENCEMTDADGDLFTSWGDTDPLPHQFPRSLDLVGLARFNGDGTAYRYSA